MDRPLDLQTLKATSVLGRGAKGVVFLVKSKNETLTLALKAISKSSIERKKKNTEGKGEDDAYRRIWFERDVLLSLRHPLLPSLRGLVSTDSIVAFAMDVCPGGDLGSLRRKQSENMFSDDIIRFYATELVLALEHLHGIGIVYRDLKPDNIMIQESGHVMLIDYDLAVRLPPVEKSPFPPPPPKKKSETPPAIKNHRRKWRFLGCFSTPSDISPEIQPPVDTAEVSTSVSGSAKSNSFVGTEDYVAPEIIKGDGHDFAVDWWSLGVVLYEMLYGRTPFRGQNRKETFYRILTKEPELVGEKTALRDLIGRLLEKDPGKRISCGEMKGHEFFAGVEWEHVLEISRAPFIPVGAEWEEEEGKEGIDMEKFVEEVFGNRSESVEEEEKVLDSNPQKGGKDGDSKRAAGFDVF